MKAAKRLQDVLGEHQDAVVAQERLRALAAREPAAAMAAGRLIERERARADRAPRAWPAAWKRVAARRMSLLDRITGGKIVRAAGGRRRARRLGGARRAPAEVRRLDVSEGEGRAGRERRGMRAP